MVVAEVAFERRHTTTIHTINIHIYIYVRACVCGVCACVSTIQAELTIFAHVRATLHPGHNVPRVHAPHQQLPLSACRHQQAIIRRERQRRHLYTCVYVCTRTYVSIQCVHVNMCKRVYMCKCAYVYV